MGLEERNNKGVICSATRLPVYKINPPHTSIVLSPCKSSLTFTPQPSSSQARNLHSQGSSRLKSDLLIVCNERCCRCLWDNPIKMSCDNRSLDRCRLSSLSFWCSEVRLERWGSHVIPRLNVMLCEWPIESPGQWNILGWSSGSQEYHHAGQVLHFHRWENHLYQAGSFIVTGLIIVILIKLFCNQKISYCERTMTLSVEEYNHHLPTYCKCLRARQSKWKMGMFIVHNSECIILAYISTPVHNSADGSNTAPRTVHLKFWLALLVAIGEGSFRRTT